MDNNIWNKIILPTSSFNVQYLVVGGGGSAGCGNEPNGAGGSGGYLSSSSYAVTPKTYTITVGAGGAQPTSSANELGNDGSNSRFDDFIAIGGGAGGSRGDTASANVGKDGASGGGGGTKDDGSTSTTISGGSATTQTIDNKPTNIIDGSIFYGSDVNKEYLRTPESDPVSHSGGTSGTEDASGIDCNGSNPRGGWGQQVKTGHPLVGKSLKTLTVSTRFSLEPANRVDRDMTVKVFAGLNTATIRGTSDAISTSTLTTAGTYYEKTFTFATPVPISADDCILVCIDGITGTTRSWNCKIRDGTNEDSGKGYWVTFNSANFPPSNAVQTNRSMIYTATYVTPATWSEV